MLEIKIKNAEQILQELQDVQEQLRELSNRIRKLRFFEIEATEKPANTQSASQNAID